MRCPPIIPPAAAAEVAACLARDLDYMRRLHNRLMALEHSKRGPLVSDLAAAIEATGKAAEHWRRLAAPATHMGDPISPPGFGRLTSKVGRFEGRSYSGQQPGVAGGVDPGSRGFTY